MPTNRCTPHVSRVNSYGAICTLCCTNWGMEVGLLRQIKVVGIAPEAAEILGTLEGVMLGSVHPSGAGTFIFPGLFKVVLRKVPARKAGTMIRNPATGEMMKAAAKPASVRVKIRPLSKLKMAAVR